MKWFLLLAALFGASAIMLDAFFAHGLKSFLGYHDQGVFEALKSASRYQLLMSVALLSLIIFYRSFPSIWLVISIICLSLGIIFFCTPIYLRYLCDIPNFSGLSPGGGILMMAAFLALIPLIWAL